MIRSKGPRARSEIWVKNQDVHSDALAVAGNTGGAQPGHVSQIERPQGTLRGPPTVTWQ